MNTAYGMQYQNNRIRRGQVRQVSRRGSLFLEAFQYDLNYDYSSHRKVKIGKMDMICDILCVVIVQLLPGAMFIFFSDRDEYASESEYVY